MLSSSCDVPDDLETIRKEFPDYDFSMVDKMKIPEFWALEVLETQDSTHKLISEFERKSNESLKIFLNEKLKQSFPNRIEFQHDVNRRVGNAKTALKETMKELNEGETLAIVAHSRLLESFSAESYEEDGAPVNAKWFANCEVVPYRLDE